eukprot:m.170780 g.170780  ORF g.170780 m.170780 type:complete len:617 (-) comp17257_c1_seq3:648-2498(-)
MCPENHKECIHKKKKRLHSNNKYKEIKYMSPFFITPTQVSITREKEILDPQKPSPQRKSTSQSPDPSYLAPQFCQSLLDWHLRDDNVHQVELLDTLAREDGKVRAVVVDAEAVLAVLVVAVGGVAVPHLLRPVGLARAVERHAGEVGGARGLGDADEVVAEAREAAGRVVAHDVALGGEEELLGGDLLAAGEDGAEQLGGGHAVAVAGDLHWLRVLLQPGWRVDSHVVVAEEEALALVGLGAGRKLQEKRAADGHIVRTTAAAAAFVAGGAAQIGCDNLGRQGEAEVDVGQLEHAKAGDVPGHVPEAVVHDDGAGHDRGGAAAKVVDGPQAVGAALADLLFGLPEELAVVADVAWVEGQAVVGRVERGDAAAVRGQHLELGLGHGVGGAAHGGEVAANLGQRHVAVGALAVAAQRHVGGVVGQAVQIQGGHVDGGIHAVVEGKLAKGRLAVVDVHVAELADGDGVVDGAVVGQPALHTVGRIVGRLPQGIDGNLLGIEQGGALVCAFAPAAGEAGVAQSLGHLAVAGHAKEKVLEKETHVHRDLGQSHHLLGGAKPGGGQVVPALVRDVERGRRIDQVGADLRRPAKGVAGGHARGICALGRPPVHRPRRREGVDV